jgi:DNA helicase HerA-like ATPase
VEDKMDNAEKKKELSQKQMGQLGSSIVGKSKTVKELLEGELEENIGEISVFFTRPDSGYIDIGGSD